MMSGHVGCMSQGTADKSGPGPLMPEWRWEEERGKSRGRTTQALANEMASTADHFWRLVFDIGRRGSSGAKETKKASSSPLRLPSSPPTDVNAVSSFSFMLKGAGESPWSVRWVEATDRSRDMV